MDRKGSSLLWYYHDNPTLWTPTVQVNLTNSSCRYRELQTGQGQDVLYTNMPESRHLADFLEGTKPKHVLEIGGGVGRCSVYLAKRFGWDATFYMLDGDEGDKQIAPIDGEDGQYYNSHNVTQSFMEANGLKSINVTEPREADLIYSFMAIGFHWPISFYLDKLKCKKGTLAIFGIRGTDRGRAFSIKQIESVGPEWSIERVVMEPGKLRSSVLVLKRAAT